MFISSWILKQWHEQIKDNVSIILHIMSCLVFLLFHRLLAVLTSAFSEGISWVVYFITIKFLHICINHFSFSFFIFKYQLVSHPEKRKMKNCAKSIISCLKSLFIKWILMHTKDTNILLSFELSYSGMGKNKFWKKLHSHQQWVGIAIFIKIIYMFIEDKSGLCTL